MLIGAAVKRAGQHEPLTEPIGGAFINKRKIDVARGRIAAIGQLAFDPNRRRKLGFDQRLDPGDDVGDSESARSACAKLEGGELSRCHGQIPQGVSSDAQSESLYQWPSRYRRATRAVGC